MSDAPTDPVTHPTYSAEHVALVETHGNTQSMQVFHSRKELLEWLVLVEPQHHISCSSCGRRVIDGVSKAALDSLAIVDCAECASKPLTPREGALRIGLAKALLRWAEEEKGAADDNGSQIK